VHRLLILTCESFLIIADPVFEYDQENCSRWSLAELAEPGASLRGELENCEYESYGGGADIFIKKLLNLASKVFQSRKYHIACLSLVVDLSCSSLTPLLNMIKKTFRGGFRLKCLKLARLYAVN